MTVPSFIDRVDNLLGRAEALTAGHHAARHLAMARERLNDPLRIAIAGRVKAGKSTLLNALIGERLAPTDASECTQVVTWYRKGSHYEAKTFLTDGTTRRLRFEREQSRLEIHLDDMHPDDLDRIEVEWPSRRLDDLVLIDTPGLESTRVAAGDRTLRFFGMDQDTPGQADAVVYLLRHMHRSDADFLESFLDRSMAQPSPFNAVAVLSRADELGAGRLDAMTSAQTIAKRYAEDRRVRVLCSGIVPVAGLLAETGVTLREDEVAALRVVAACDQEELQSILLSADRFRDPALTELPSGIRYRLLERFGMFGLRFALHSIAENPQVSAPDLSGMLVEHSGIPALMQHIDEHFRLRADVLKARSGLVALRGAAKRVGGDDPAMAATLLAWVEALEAGSSELGELRLWHSIVSGRVDLADAEIEEIRTLISTGDPAIRLGAVGGMEPSKLQDLAIAGASRWRERAGHPLADRALQEVAELTAQLYERLFVILAAPAER